MPIPSRTLPVLALVGLSACLERQLDRIAPYLTETADTRTDSSSSLEPDGSSSHPVHTVTGGSSGSTSTGQDDATGETTRASSTGGDTSTNTGTTHAPEVCGDGDVQGEEECDDPEDLEESACTAACTRPRLVFLTSERFSGADINGLDGGDTRCRGLAAMAGIPDPGNFKAILSDGATHARDRLHHGRGPYRLINGLQVAQDFDALMNEALEHPIDTTELGTAGYPGAWTGTELGGTAVPGGPHCEDWHSGSGFDYGHYGRPTAVEAEWLRVANPIVNPTACNLDLALYCAEQQ